MKRSKNLNENDIGQIVEILDGWTGRLSWDMFISAIELRRYTRYTRQTLHKHERIRCAFSLRKAALGAMSSPGDIRSVSPELSVALERIARLEAENARIRSENSRLLEQFVRWAYNAHNRGLDKAFLNQPLPRVDRDQTRIRIAKK